MKKLDIVVWSEEEGYYANKLPYGTDLGAPVIKQQDIVGWKQSGVNKANSYFEAKYKEIKERYDDLINEFKWTELLYKAKYNFEPILDHSYHLYCDDKGEFFLSLISPLEWKNCPTFIGTFKLDDKYKWKKV